MFTNARRKPFAVSKYHVSPRRPATAERDGYVEHRLPLQQNLRNFVSSLRNLDRPPGVIRDAGRRINPQSSVNGRHKVCWPTMGNHEGRTSSGRTGIGPYYDAYVVPTRGEAGGLASGTEAYYSFDYANIHFICLDSHDLDRRPTEPMARWLKADLEKTRADWLIAFWHHPPYTKGSHDSDKERDLMEMRQHIMPIIEQGGVDVVFTGHSHTYERSMLMDGAYATNTVAENVILDDGAVPLTVLEQRVDEWIAARKLQR